MSTTQNEKAPAPTGASSTTTQTEFSICPTTGRLVGNDEDSIKMIDDVSNFWSVGLDDVHGLTRADLLRPFERDPKGLQWDSIPHQWIKRYGVPAETVTDAQLVRILDAERKSKLDLDPRFIDSAAQSMGVKPRLTDEERATELERERVENEKALRDAGHLPATKPMTFADYKRTVTPYALSDIAKSSFARSTIEELNERYAWIERKGRVLLRDADRISFLQRDAFTTTYNNRLLEGKPLGNAWLQHEHRATFTDVGLYPPPLVAPVDHFNMWRGFAVEPKPGEWSLFRSFIYDVIASGDVAAAEYVIKWIAWSLQNPGLPAEAAIALRGLKGIGKGTLGNALCKIFGSHASHITNADHFCGSRFNAHLAGAAFVFADECYWSGDKRHEGSLKAMITEPQIFVEPKGIDGYMVPNVLHLIMATNDEWVVPATIDERRFVVLEVSDKHRRDSAYFNPLRAEMDNGGLAAMVHDLLSLDLDGWHPRDVIETAALDAQRELSLPYEQEWLKDVLNDGELPCSNHWTAKRERDFITSADLKSELKAACKNGRVPKTTKTKKLMESVGAVYEKNATDQRGWRFPSLDEARRNWDANYYARSWDVRASW
jgi:hypothetical protein